MPFSTVPATPSSDLGREATLTDLLAHGLDVIFIGINPSLFSVAHGHYFARRSNRFWPCFSRSTLSEAARQALGVERLEPAHDRALLDHGFGFTDLAKRASARASDLPPEEFAAGVAALVAKLERYRPRIACFHGLTAYRPFQKALAPAVDDPRLGQQSLQIGVTRLFAVPNPSPANAHFTPADQTRWYDEVALCLAALKR